jgi:hypothetical protein
MTVLLLTPASLLWDANPWPLRLTMVLLGTVTVTVIGLAGRRLGGRRVGLLAAAVAAVMPALWINDILLMSETPAALLTALIVWAGIVLAERQTTALVVGIGVLCGLGALTRAELGLLLPLMVWPIILLAKDASIRQKAGSLALATVASVAVVAPWAALNQSRFERPVLISTNDGITLAGANCDDAYRGDRKGGWIITPCVVDAYARLEQDKPAAPAGSAPCFDTFQTRPPCLDPSEVSADLRSQGLDYASDHLGELPSVALARNGRVWGLYRFDQSLATGIPEGRPRWATALAFGFAWLMVPLSAFALWLLRRRGVSLIPFLAPLALVIITTTAFTGLAPRYRLPWDVASCLLAATTLAFAHQQITRSRATTPEGAVQD